MPLCDQQQRFGGAGRLTPALLPLLERSLRNPERSRELSLRQTAIQPHLHNLGLRLDLGALTAASLDFPDTVEHLLPNIATRLEIGQRFTTELLSHYEMPPATASK